MYKIISASQGKIVLVNLTNSEKIFAIFNLFGSALVEVISLIQTSFLHDLGNIPVSNREYTKGLKYDHTGFGSGKRVTKKQQKSDSFKVRSK
jgi:hypothetical protein